MIGTLGKFDPKTQTVSCYDERLLLYLTENDIANTRAKRSSFMSSGYDPPFRKDRADGYGMDWRGHDYYKDWTNR